MLRFAFATAAAGLCIAVATPVEAQAPACVKRTDLVQHLASKYKEAPVAVTMPGGLTCMIATGQSWQDLPRVTASVETPA